MFKFRPLQVRRAFKLGLILENTSQLICTELYNLVFWFFMFMFFKWTNPGLFQFDFHSFTICLQIQHQFQQFNLKKRRFWAQDLNLGSPDLWRLPNLIKHLPNMLMLLFYTLYKSGKVQLRQTSVCLKPRLRLETFQAFNRLDV